MLVLSRRKNESVIYSIDGEKDLEIYVIEVRGDKVRLGFDYPNSSNRSLHRREVYDAINREKEST